MHLIPSPTLQNPGGTELVSLHYGSDRRWPGLCHEYPECFFALIQSMRQEPRRREVLSPCSYSPASIESQSRDEHERLREGEESRKSCTLGFYLYHVMSPDQAIFSLSNSPYEIFPRSNLCSGVQQGLPLLCLLLLFPSLHKSKLVTFQIVLNWLRHI